VFLGVDTRDGNRLVAVKQIALAGLEEQRRIRVQQCYAREVSVLNWLRHPHVPRLLAAFQEGEDLYLVMEYIAGVTLADYCRQRGGHLSLAEVLAIGIALACILEDLHAMEPAALLFRDLKPENVLITPGGTLYLVDFGNSCWYIAGHEQTRSVFGTPGYQAPEQHGGLTSPTTDIYGLGALLHWLLTGDDLHETPFTRPPLGWQWHPLFACFERLLVAMTALEEWRRPRSIQQVRCALQTIATQDRGVFPAISPHAPLTCGTYHPRVQIPPFPAQHAGAPGHVPVRRQGTCTRGGEGDHALAIAALVGCARRVVTALAWWQTTHRQGEVHLAHYT
jgi:serine/threonine protein kinase